MLRVHFALQQPYIQKRSIVLQSFGHNRLVLVRERVTADQEALQAATNTLKVTNVIYKQAINLSNGK